MCEKVIKDEVVEIVENVSIAKDTFRMKLTSTIHSYMKPGQFVNIKVEGFMLRRPISICSIDTNGFTIIYKVVGDGTKRLAMKQAKESIQVLGPLGTGYPIHKELSEVLLLGGGVGVPPLYELAKQYRQLHKKVYVALGFQDAKSVFYEKEFQALGCDVVIATMDGSYGVKGTVLDAVKEKQIHTDFVYSCGPVRMLKAIEDVYQKGYVSFEARMACGIGACMACVAKDKKEELMYHRICKEGPVFSIGKVEYEWT